MVAEPEEVEPRDLRVSHAEREHVQELLSQALQRGMLDVDEFGARAERATAARTRQDLNALVTDLAVTRTGPPGRADHSAAQAGDDVVTWEGTFSSLKRQGAWRVPRKLVLRRRMGSVELDFTQARIEYPVVEIELDTAGGSVEMRLPDGASASIEGVQTSFGSAEDHRRSRVLDGTPHFVITGEVCWGSLEVRGPRRWPFRSSAR